MICYTKQAIQVFIFANHGEIFIDMRMATIRILFFGATHEVNSVTEYGKWFSQSWENDLKLFKTFKDNIATHREFA